jgi:dihydroorotate dehydrogenase
MFYSRLLKPIFFRMDPEKAHELAVSIGLRLQQSDAARAFLSDFFAFNDPKLEVKAAGLTFPNPVGLAAGFDKNALLLPILESIGFGFIEIGSITSLPSPGNPKPRLFRLPDDLALINRMGLNNDGAEIITNRLQNRSSNIPIGVNIAKTPQNKLSGDEAVQDYVNSYKQALAVADYVTINISCPNTGDGKSFEEPESFRALINSLRNTENSSSKPLFIKFSADTDPSSLKKLISIAEEYQVDGYVAVNTSTSRSGLKTDSETILRIGNGGLSGKPVAEKSLIALDEILQIVGSTKPVISVGGISSPEDAHKRLEKGAKLIQLYTGLIYNGPAFPGKINRYLAHAKK